LSDETRRAILERQGHVCTICHCRLNGSFILHHIKNRCQGGSSGAHNLEARHSHCEQYAHKNFSYGNPTGLTFNDDYRPPKKIKANKKKLRSDRRQLNVNLLIFDENYAFREYCKGRIE
jgi:hypothetical protein